MVRLFSNTSVATVAPVRWLLSIAIVFGAFTCTVRAQSEKIIKVLPHYLDKKGRASITPSLFDRDAYQAQLREKPELQSGIRFDVNWRSSYFSNMKLRVEVKGANGREPKQYVLEREVSNTPLEQWTALTFTGDEFKKFGQLISWRATLLSGTNIIAQHKSFLW